MKKTARAPSNIAFIKYWGKQDERLHVPLNASVSMNLSGAHTVTTVDFSPAYREDSIVLIGKELSAVEKKRVIDHLGVVRKKAGIRLRARVVSRNSFPRAAGVASSASGFAALTVAAAAAAGLELPERELSILARLGSGSACRSIPDGFVMWGKGKTSKESYAYSLSPANYWDLRDIVILVERGTKRVGSTVGMKGVKTSRLMMNRIATVEKRMALLLDALKKRDFPSFGRLIEEESVSVHAVMVTQNPPVLYWNDATIAVVRAVSAWRDKGLPAYTTIDAGPNVHVLCEGKNVQRILKKLKRVRGIESIIVNKPARGTHLIHEHLF